MYWPCHIDVVTLTVKGKDVTAAAVWRQYIELWQLTSIMNWCLGNWEVVPHGKWIHWHQRRLLRASTTRRCTTELLSCGNTQVPLSAVLARRRTATRPVGSQYRGPSFASTSQYCWHRTTFHCCWPIDECTGRGSCMMSRARSSCYLVNYMLRL